MLGRPVGYVRRVYYGVMSRARLAPRGGARLVKRRQPARGAGLQVVQEQFGKLLPVLRGAGLHQVRDEGLWVSREL